MPLFVIEKMRHEVSDGSLLMDWETVDGNCRLSY